MIEDRIDEDTTDGILVVQVRGLGTIFRDVHEPAANQALLAKHDRAAVAAGWIRP
jgi:hypothetical protein